MEDEKGELVWYVAHTKPRCEKKLVSFCQREGLEATLPTYQSVKKYLGKTVTFEKVLFANYVFLKLHPFQSRKVYQSDYVANMLTVVDQKLFEEQLMEILSALETEVEVFLAPRIIAGRRVKIKSGPLRGIEGQVEERSGMTTVLLRLDFISQAAAVKVDATELELID